MTTVAHSRRAAAALARMPEIDPAIAALALWCRHRDDPGQTRTRGDTILYGPSFEALSLPEQTGLLAHHVLHVALRHSGRADDLASRLGDDFDRGRFTLACDGLINDLLIEGGHAVPRPAVRGSELIARVGGPKVDVSALIADWTAERLYLALLHKPRRGETRDTDTADGYARDKQFRPDLDGDPKEDRGPDAWRARLEQAFATGRAAGTGIGPVLRRFADLPNSSVPWEVRLRRLLLRAVSDRPRRSFKRPTHGWIAREAEARTLGGGAVPVFEPGAARDARRARIVVALDTSSSVSDTQLDLFASEALAIARRSGAETLLLGFDTEVHSRGRLDRETLVDLEMRRGGGTAFADVIAEAARLGPSITVILTDLDGPVGATPSFPVLWAVPHAPAQVPPFGTILEMDR